MRPGIIALAVGVLISGKQPPASPPAGGAGSATPVIAPTTDSGNAAPAAGLAFNVAAADEPPEAPAIAFYGVANFAEFSTEGYFNVDKTPLVPVLEALGPATCCSSAHVDPPARRVGEPARCGTTIV